MPENENHGGQSHQGFAAMDEDRRREIASEGGKAAHASGHAHEFTPEEAREAGSHSHDNTNQSSRRGSDDEENPARILAAAAMNSMFMLASKATKTSRASCHDLFQNGGGIHRHSGFTRSYNHDHNCVD